MGRSSWESEGFRPRFKRKNGPQIRKFAGPPCLGRRKSCETNSIPKLMTWRTTGTNCFKMEAKLGPMFGTHRRIRYASGISQVNVPDRNGHPSWKRLFEGIVCIKTLFHSAVVLGEVFVCSQPDVPNRSGTRVAFPRGRLIAEANVGFSLP